MQWLWITVWTYVVFVLHSSLAREIAIGESAPHLALAGLILLVVRVPGRRGLLLAAAWGLVADCLSGARLGSDVVAFVAVTLVIQWGGIRLGLRSPWRLALVAAALAWCCGMFDAWLAMPLGGAAGLLGAGLVALGPALYTGAVVGAMSLAAWRIGSQTGRDSVRVAAVSNQWRMLTE